MVIKKCEAIFIELKRIIVSEPILRQSNWDVIFHVHVDDSRLALGSILAQLEDKVDFPVYFTSIRFSKVEHGYLQREALGMIFFSKILSLSSREIFLFLCGSPGTAISDQ